MTSAKRSRTGVVVGLVAVVVFGGCCLSCGLLLWYGKTRSDAEIAPLRPLVAACQGQPVAGTAARGTSHGRVRAQAVIDDAIGAYWLPAEQRSTSLGDTEIVVCQGELERYLADRCTYETGLLTGLTGGQNVIERYAYRREYRAVAASTGVEVARRTFDGRPPDPCPPSEEFDTGGETQSISGGAPSPEVVHAWIAEVASSP